MHARITTTTLAADESNTAAEVFEQILPTIRALTGYRGMMIRRLGRSGDRRNQPLGATEADLAASAAVMDGIRAAETSARSVDSQDASTYQVVAFDLSD